jgi:hypothetical protein
VEKRLQIVDDFSSSDDEEEEEENESEVEDDNDEEDVHNTELIPSNEPNKINLDVSTLICLVSELTHGGHVYRYPNKWLEVPAELERAERLAPKLENYMKGLFSYLTFVLSCFMINRKRIICMSNSI